MAPLIVVGPEKNWIIQFAKSGSSIFPVSRKKLPAPV
jgi:hypothetical protein